MRKFTPYVGALVLLLAAPLMGQLPDSFIERIGAEITSLEELLASAPTTPQARFDAWQRAILRFPEAQPSLTEEQLLALLDAVDLVQVNTFEDDSAAGLKSLRASLDAMRETLTTDEFISLLGHFDGLQSWLYKNGLIEGFVVKAIAGETCNCNSSWDCVGVACQDVSCTSGPGSNSWGICGGGGSPE